MKTLHSFNIHRERFKFINYSLKDLQRLINRDHCSFRWRLGLEHKLELKSLKDLVQPAEKNVKAELTVPLETRTFFTAPSSSYTVTTPGLRTASTGT